MKALDIFLLSMAIGLLFFTTTLFSSDYPRGFVQPAPEHAAPDRPSSFSAIVLHTPDAHRALPFHFIIEDGSRGPDGAIITCGAWRTQTAVSHTSDAGCNAAAISIAIRSGHTEAQERALLDLLERLCRAHHIAPSDIGLHGEMEAAPDCPAGPWDMDALRDELTQRLEK